MAKDRITLRLDEWMRKDIASIASAKGIPATALIREFIMIGLDRFGAQADQLSIESEKTERQLKLITETVLGTLYTVIALRDQSTTPSPDAEMCRKAISAGALTAEKFLSQIEGDE